ncbi:Hypothetical protein ADP8_03194a (plasmid) [Roseomonas mucosa]|nr:Hypothetical protein ADP8_03194a [Roseomonas mucosa]
MAEFESTGEHGSSPRSRGTLARRFRGRADERFIPALAGNTGGSPRRHPRGSVHPRARGEHGIAHALHVAMDGSSPRSRGTLFL